MEFELVEIQKIDSYEVKQEIVYDLTVEDNHSYCVDDGIVVHNSVCTTRIVTGVGMPQLSAIMECAESAHGLKGHICGDGGCTDSGSIAKAFGGGSDYVMLGSMLSGHEECEGEWEMEANWVSSHNEHGHHAMKHEGYKKKYLKFYGMSSAEAMDRYSNGVKDYKSPEGKCVKVPYKGAVNDTLKQIMGGLRSTCTYVGTEKLKDLSKCCTFNVVNRTHNTIFS